MENKIDLDELRQRLRGLALTTTEEASDALSQLQAENAELRRELEEARKPMPEPPLEQFAIVIDRQYDGEGLSLAVHNGINFMFSDGDCYDREGDTLDGYTAEFLTQYQLEKRLEDARKDADRYQTIAKSPTGTIRLDKVVGIGLVCPRYIHWSPEKPLDAAIDAANQQQGEDAKG